MEIKIGKRTITIIPKTFFHTMFILVLLATITQMIINVLSNSILITGMVVFSACTTGLCYYFSKESN